MNEDAVFACADLVNRCGASEFEIGYLRDDPDNPGWYAHAKFQGTRLITDEHKTPSGAAVGLAERLLDGGQCKCGQTISLSDANPGCRWQLMGKRWESGCDAAPVKVDGERGDIDAMKRAMDERKGR